jgi:regulator of sirC expression with transglutaminase-like and TPR domain
MKMYTDTEVDSLIRLLADDDETMLTIVSDRLFEIGDAAVSSLWDARLQVSLATRDRIDHILSRLSVDAGRELAMEEWQGLSAQPGELDLEKGIAGIARSNFPDLNWDKYSRKLDEMADELAIRMIGVSDPHDVIELFTQYMFQEQQFTGPDLSAYEPDDCYINQVLDRKRGLPISLSALCMLIGNRLSLPIHGLGLPGHFIAKYQVDDTEVLFDPYHEGMVVTREECEEMIIRNQYRYPNEFFEPYSNRMILARMLGNLRNIYLQQHDRERLSTVTRYFKLVTGD